MNRHLCFYRVLIAALLLLIFGGLHADIVVMKSGDKKIGKIIAEDEVSVTLQYQSAAQETAWSVSATRPRRVQMARSSIIALPISFTSWRGVSSRAPFWQSPSWRPPFSRSFLLR
jgi:hypothetical protein